MHVSPLISPTLGPFPGDGMVDIAGPAGLLGCPSLTVQSPLLTPPSELQVSRQRSGYPVPDDFSGRSRGGELLSPLTCIWLISLSRLSNPQT